MQSVLRCFNVSYTTHFITRYARVHKIHENIHKLSIGSDERHHRDIETIERQGWNIHHLKKPNFIHVILIFYSCISKISSHMCFLQLCTLLSSSGIYLFLIINTRHFTKCSFELEKNNRNMKLWFCPTFSYQWGLPLYTACTNALYTCWIFTSKMAPRGSICGMYTCNSVEKLGF